MLIAGAGGFAREMLEILFQLDINQEIYFYDDIHPSVKEIGNRYPVLKKEEEVANLFQQNSSFCLGIGGTVNRENFFNKFLSFGGVPATIISPYARIGQTGISIGKGVCITTGTVITTNVFIDTGCLINLNCTVGHDTRIGKFCELSPGVHLSGGCTIGDYCSIGTGAVVLPGITINNKVTIGAGAVVTKDIQEGLTVAGIPALPLIKK